MRIAMLCALVAGIGGQGINSGSLGDGIGGRVQRVVSAGGAAPTVTIDAMPYTRTVTCTGSYTLTGSATESPSSVSWSASPSGASGSCTGTSSWSCAVAVAPASAGEGVETITVTATNGTGNGTDTETIGFYVNGAHSCFLAQSVDGSYNSTLANNDPVTTWVNLGSSALDVTQATAGSKPTYKTAIVGGQPVVSFDGGDRIAASTAADWSWLHREQQMTVHTTLTITNITSARTVFATRNNGAGSTGALFYHNLTNGRQLFGAYLAGVANHVTNNITNDSVDVTKYVSYAYQRNISGSDQLVLYKNGSSFYTLGITPTYDTTTGPNGGFTIGGAVDLSSFLGSIFIVLVYNSELSSTQHTLNKQVDEWALGASFPVTP